MKTLNSLFKGKLILVLFLSLFGCLWCYPTTDRYYELADSADYYITKEKWDEAQNKIIEAMRLQPANFNNSLLFSNLGLVQLQKKEYENAIQSFTLGLSIAPSSVTLLNNRAKAYLLNEQIKEALSDLNKSLSLDSIQEWPLQTLGFITFQMGEISKAEQIFKNLTVKFPGNSMAHSGLAYIYEKKGDYYTALSEYEKSISINPSDEETICSKIFLLIEMGKYEEARKEINQYIFEYPDNALLYLQRGYLHKLNYRLEEAKADKKLAIEKGLDPLYVEKFIPDTSR